MTLQMMQHLCSVYHKPKMRLFDAIKIAGEEVVKYKETHFASDWVEIKHVIRVLVK